MVVAQRRRELLRLRAKTIDHAANILGRHETRGNVLIDAPVVKGTVIEADRNDWTRAAAEALYALPFADLMFRAQTVHRRHFDPNRVETASLLSIKTGGCPEDCGYCSQSA